MNLIDKYVYNRLVSSGKSGFYSVNGSTYFYDAKTGESQIVYNKETKQTNKIFSGGGSSSKKITTQQVKQAEQQMSIAPSLQNQMQQTIQTPSTQTSLKSPEQLKEELFGVKEAQIFKSIRNKQAEQQMSIAPSVKQQEFNKIKEKLNPESSKIFDWEIKTEKIYHSQLTGKDYKTQEQLKEDEEKEKVKAIEERKKIPYFKRIKEAYVSALPENYKEKKEYFNIRGIIRAAFELPSPLTYKIEPILEKNKTLKKLNKPINSKYFEDFIIQSVFLTPIKTTTGIAKELNLIGKPNKISSIGRVVEKSEHGIGKVIKTESVFSIKNGYELVSKGGAETYVAKISKDTFLIAGKSKTILKGVIFPTGKVITKIDNETFAVGIGKVKEIKNPIVYSEKGIRVINKNPYYLTVIKGKIKEKTKKELLSFSDVGLSTIRNKYIGAISGGAYLKEGVIYRNVSGSLFKIMEKDNVVKTYQIGGKFKNNLEGKKIVSKQKEMIVSSAFSEKIAKNFIITKIEKVKMPKMIITRTKNIIFTQQMTYPITKVKTKNTNKFNLGYSQIIEQKTEINMPQKLVSLNSLLQNNKNKLKNITKVKQNIENKLKYKENLIYNQKQNEKIKLKQKTKTKTKITIPLINISIIKIPKNRVFPITQNKKLKLNIIKPKQKKEVYVKRYGKFRLVGIFKNEPQAFKRGISITSSTLARTFLIKGSSINKFSNYKIKKGNIGTLFIEPSKTALSSVSEKKEIEYFRRNKWMKKNIQVQ